MGVTFHRKLIMRLTRLRKFLVDEWYEYQAFRYPSLYKRCHLCNKTRPYEKLRKCGDWFVCKEFECQN